VWVGEMMQNDHGLAEHILPVSEKIGLVVATGMVSSPFWLQYLKVVSDIAALLAPILGCTYLLLQIGFKIRRMK